MKNTFFDAFYGASACYFGQEPTKSLVRFLSRYDVKPGKVIDIGAGEGRNTFYLAEKGFQVTAIEPSVIGAREILSQAQSFSQDIYVINDVYLTQTLTEIDFDIIVAVTSLDHMIYDDVIQSVLDIKQRLKKGGYVFAVVFTEDDPGNRNDVKNASDCANQIKHYFRQNELKKLFSDFEILEYKETETVDESHGKPHKHNKATLVAKKQ